MKTFEEFITEGKRKNERRELEQNLHWAWNRGRDDSHMVTTASSVKPMTPEQVLKHSGRKAIERHLKQIDKRRNKAVEKLMGRLEEKISLIPYFGAKRHKVFQNGREKTVPEGKAVPKRSSSSAGGCGS